MPVDIRFLFPECLVIQVPREFHGVVQNPPDDNLIVLHPVNQEGLPGFVWN